MKKCTRCKKKKQSSEFQKRVASVDGLTASCKKCLSDYDKDRADLPHRVKAREDYAKTPKGIKAGNKAKNAWGERNTVKRGANIIVGNAIRSGAIEKGVYCESCESEPKRIHGHHDDYAYPLSVTWLCPKCHKNWHTKNGEGKNAN